MLTKQRIALPLAAVLLGAACGAAASARQGRDASPPRPAPRADEDQATVRIFTEEVALPVVAYDFKGRFDPTLEKEDVLVLEDGVPQQVRSVRRLPASVLLVFDMGGLMTATRSMNTSRDIAQRFVAGLGPGDQAAVIQNSTRGVELLSDWTADAGAVGRVLRTQLFSGRSSRLSRCLLAAADKLRGRPVGNTHVLVFTDGVESQADKGLFDAAVKRLAATQATAHVIAYSALAREAVRVRGRNPFDLDFQMKRSRRKYAEETKRQDERLAALVAELGGRLYVPADDGEAIAQADEAARDIGSQYVVTYAPKRPFADSGDRRRVSVSSRRMGIRLLLMRDHVTRAAVAGGGQG
jgi:VWFA-related protein